LVDDVAVAVDELSPFLAGSFDFSDGSLFEGPPLDVSPLFEGSPFFDEPELDLESVE
jgi:hypothetical protein